MTTTFERASQPLDTSIDFFDKIDDTQLRQDLYAAVSDLKERYQSYLTDPQSIPESWRENLEGVDASDYETVLAELCVKSDDIFPDLDSEEHPTQETKVFYSEIREAAFDSLMNNEVENVSANQQPRDGSGDSVLQRRMSSNMYGSLKHSKAGRAAVAPKATPLSGETLVQEEANNSKKPVLDAAFMAEFNTHVDELAEEYAAKLAKESDRSLGQMFHERSDRKMREELVDMMGGLATQLMDTAIESGIPKAERDQLIDRALNVVTADIIQKMADARLQEYTDSSPIRKFVYSKWSKWGEQGKLGKVKKGIVMGAVSAPLAIAAAPIAGAAVGAGIAGALLATGSRSLGRGIISAHINQKANAPENIEKQRWGIQSEVWEQMLSKPSSELTSYDVLDVIDSKVDMYRRRNRRRVLGGVGIAMSVGLVSATAADFLAENVFASEPAIAKAGNESSQPNRNVLGLPEEREDLGVAKDATGFDELSGSESRTDLGSAVEAPGRNAGNEVNASNGQLGREGMFRGYHGTRNLTPEGEKMLETSLDNYRVKSGDTIWGLSEQICKEQGIKNPTVYEIDATKDLLLEKLEASGSVDKSGVLVAGIRLKI